MSDELNHIFYPKSVAVVGASANQEKAGFMCFSNLLQAGYKGRIYPVNPNLSELLGLKVYPSVTAVPGEVDLAMIVIPAQLTISAVEECAAKGVKGTIIISSGFNEVGTERGLDLQVKLKDIAARSGMRIIGPNTVGLVNPRANLCASFQLSLGLSQPGNVAVVTQSGGVCIYIVHALIDSNIGISKAIGLGNRCNVDFDEMVTYLISDEETKIIILYIEGLEQPRRLIRVAMEGVKRKPILVYKGGRTEKSSGATLSHTGTLAGKYELYKAAFVQSGMIITDSITELVDIAKALDLQKPPSGNRVAILSGQAGPGIVIADKCQALGLSLAELSPTSRNRLRQLISPLNSVDNPVDIGWKSSEFDTSRDILKVVLEDNAVDAVLVAAVYHQANMPLMQSVVDIAKSYEKPIVVSLDSPGGLASAVLSNFEKNRVPAYSLPERAVTGMAGLVRYAEILKTIQ